MRVRPRAPGAPPSRPWGGTIRCEESDQAGGDGRRLDGRIGDDQRPGASRSALQAFRSAMARAGSSGRAPKGENRAAAGFRRGSARRPSARRAGGRWRARAPSPRTARGGAVALFEILEVAARRSAGTPGPCPPPRSAAPAPAALDGTQTPPAKVNFTALRRGSSAPASGACRRRARSAASRR